MDKICPFCQNELEVIFTCGNPERFKNDDCFTEWCFENAPCYAPENAGWECVTCGYSI